MQPQISLTDLKIQKEKGLQTGKEKQAVREKGVSGPQGSEKFIDKAQKAAPQAADEKLPGGNLRGNHCRRRLSQPPGCLGS